MDRSLISPRARSLISNVDYAVCFRLRSGAMSVPTPSSRAELQRLSDDEVAGH